MFSIYSSVIVCFGDSKKQPGLWPGLHCMVILPWLPQAVCKSPEAQDILALTCAGKDISSYKGNLTGSRIGCSPCPDELLSKPRVHVEKIYLYLFLLLFLSVLL